VVIAVRVLLVMLIGTAVIGACSTEECDFPNEDEILATGESATVQVRVIQGRIEQVQAAGWTYSVYGWEMRGSTQQKQWKHRKVSLADGTYARTVTALEDDDLVLTGVAADKFLLKPVGCY
jgi:hypothetical protein